MRIENHHNGYICWQEFERNQQLLANNRTNAEHMLLSGARAKGSRSSRACCCAGGAVAD